MSETGSAPASVVRVPRWYGPSLIALAVAAGVAYLVTGGQVTWGGILVTAAFGGLAAVVALAAWLLNRGGTRAADDPPRPFLLGNQVIFGLFWTVFALNEIVNVGRVGFGIVMLGVGLLTLAAFGPPWVRFRIDRWKATHPASGDDVRA